MIDAKAVRKPKSSRIRIGILRYLINKKTASAPELAEALGFDRKSTGNIDDQLQQLEKVNLIIRTIPPPSDERIPRGPRFYFTINEFELLIRIFDTPEYGELKGNLQGSEWIINKILDERLSLQEGDLLGHVRVMLLLSPEFFSRCLRTPKIAEHIFRHRILFQEHLAFTSSKYLSVLEEGIFENPINQGVNWYLPFFGVCVLSDAMNGVSKEMGMKVYEELKSTIPDTLTISELFGTVDNICQVMYQLIQNNPSDSKIMQRILENIIHCMDYQRMMEDIRSTQDLTQIPQILQKVEKILPLTVTNDEKFRTWFSEAMKFDWSKLK